LFKDFPLLKHGIKLTLLVMKQPGFANKHAYPNKDQEEREKYAEKVNIENHAKYGCQSDQDKQHTPK
jgi:hypothetical protein